MAAAAAEEEWSHFAFFFNYLLYYLLVIVLGAVFGTVCSLPAPTSPANTRFAKRYVNWVAGVFGIKYTVSGLDNIPRHSPCIIVANHQSFFDFITIMQVWPERCVCVVKSSLFWMSGPFGLAMWLAGNIFVDRGNSRSSKQTLDSVVQRINSEKLRVWVYPEGTRNDSGELLPFKKGAFHMAVQAQVPVVPVVISSYGNWAAFRQRKWLARGREVVVEVLPPIPTHGLGPADVADLTERTRTQMVDTFRQLSQRAHLATQHALHSDSANCHDKSQ